jgi:hypothetical protein
VRASRELGAEVGRALLPGLRADERQQPFSRSAHSRNPAALLVGRATDVSVFVIRSMPASTRSPTGKSSAWHVEPEVSVHLRGAGARGDPRGGALALLAAVDSVGARVSPCAAAALLALAAAFVGVRRAMAPSPVGASWPSGGPRHGSDPEEAAALPAAALVTGAAARDAAPCLFGAAAAPFPLAACAGVPRAFRLIRPPCRWPPSPPDTETGARLRSGLDSGWPSVIGGLGLCLALALSGDGQVLGWRVALRSSDQLVTLPGAGLVAGLTLLVTLAGSLGLAAHLLTPAVPSGPVRRFAGRLLVLGGGLAILCAGACSTAAPRRRCLRPLGGHSFCTSAQRRSHLIGDPVRGMQPGRPSRSAGGAGLRCRGRRETNVARAATYATPATAAAASAALLALAVVEATRLRLLRKGLLIVALVFVLIGA